MKRVLYILGHLTDDDAEWLTAVGQLRRIPAGTELIREGTAVTGIFIVIDGWLRVTIAGVGELARIGTGEIVGELSLVDSRPASATVTASSSVALLEVPKQALQARIAADTGFASRMYRAIAVFLADRMRSTIRRMGYGSQGAPVSLAEDEESDGEIDIDLLEKVHQAGARFDRIFRSLLTGGR